MMQKDRELNLKAMTKETPISSRLVKPDSPVMVYILSNNVKYLGVLVVNNLRFEEYTHNNVTKTSQRVYIVRTFLYKSFESLSALFFKSFIILSILTYCIPI